MSAEQSSVSLQRALENTRLQAALLFFLPFLLIAGCWNAPFLPYDDAGHIWQNECVVGNPSLADFFARPREQFTWQPLTTLSYRLDFLLFKHGSAAPDDWAPGVRVMTCVYHGLAALVLWRVLLLVGVGALPAFFGALCFAIHPLQCETLGWCAERKTALMGLLCFATFWAWLAGEGKLWRIPLTTALYMLALLSKGAALGIMPVIAIVELCGGAAGLRGEIPVFASRGELFLRFRDGIVRLAPLIVLSFVMMIANMQLYAYTVLPPPGGTKFTAMLTDAPIFVCYLKTVFLPIALSFNYFCEPIVSILDPRFVFSALFLLAVVGATVYFGANRWRAIFGWLWFFSAMAPMANLVSTHTLMHDRFLYVSFPGLMLVLIEVVRRVTNPAQSLVLRGVGALTLAVFLALGIARSALFADGVALFADSIAKQPLCAHSRYGMWICANQSIARLIPHRNEPRAQQEALQLRALAKQSTIDFVDHCGDTNRQLNYSEMAIAAADYGRQDNELEAAERYFKLAASPPEPYLHTSPQIESEALRNLAGLAMNAGKFDEAYDFAYRAVGRCPSFNLARGLRAQLETMLAKKLAASDERRAQALLLDASLDLESIPPSSPLYQQAQKMLIDVRGQLH